MTLAHFSDFHIGQDNGISTKRQLRLAAKLIDHALEAGVEHLLISGDVVDHANLDDAEQFAEILEERDLLSAARLSITAGNHDTYPFPHSPTGREVLEYVVGNVATFLKREDFPAEKYFRGFNKIFEASRDGVRQMHRKQPAPYVKKLGGVALAVLDTVSDDGLHRCASGRFDKDEGAWVQEQLKRHRGPKLLLMHHWPWDWAVDASGVDLPRWAEMLLERAGVDLDDVLSVSFDDAETVRQFIREAGFTAVFTGHLHDTRRDLAGGVPVYCSGEAGHQDGELLAYRLIDVDGPRVKVSTKRVDPVSL